MDSVTVSATTCLKACERGPVLVVYPANLWYGKVEGEAEVDQILDAIQANSVCEPLLLT
jgi:(2Fe-2S) ferredoxin